MCNNGNTQKQTNEQNSIEKENEKEISILFIQISKFFCYRTEFQIFLVFLAFKISPTQT